MWVFASIICFWHGSCNWGCASAFDYDIELVVYGPGLTKNAHIVDEYVELDEYADTIEIFKNTAIKYLNA